MKILFLLLVVLMTYSSAFAGLFNTGCPLMAVEIKHNDKPTGHIGRLDYLDEIVELVLFSPGIAGEIVVLPEVFHITEKKIVAEGLHHIKCENQNGSTASGTIDFRDTLKPKITLIRDSGYVITNISPGGKRWQKKNIPNITLGQ